MDSKARNDELPLWERAVSYAAIGATQSPDLLGHPPAGYRPVLRRARIGHGEKRFEHACVQAMSWGIQAGAGLTVTPVDAPVGSQVPGYRPVEFDAAGSPVSAAAMVHREHSFGPDGRELLVSGDTTVLTAHLGPIRVNAPVRVVYTIDEPRRRGFAYGTLPGHPEEGEEAFMIDRREDDSVWITIIGFSRPSSRWSRLLLPVLRLAQAHYTRRYLFALAVPID